MAAASTNKFRVSDLMNDWEIGGTQNPWVCPSDRHLQLRAQLKSGWSVRTGAARSPTTSKQALLNGISEAEQEQIQKVLARAEQGRTNERMRIGKMMERLERLKTRASGNGVTQCLLCQTEFGLLAAKSYAAMCSDCRKYVCQRNCGVETFDQKRREPVFLCKICSEYREVMWKKSGAWFYREMPIPLPPRPCSAMADPSSSASMVNGIPPCMGGGGQPGSPTARSVGSHTGPMPRRQLEQMRQESRERDRAAARASRRAAAADPVPIPAEQQQRLKTNPRPRIIPSWVHDGLQQSSVSVDDSDGAESSSSSTSSSLEPAQFRKSLGAAKERAMALKQRTNNQQQQQQQPRIPSALAGGGRQGKGQQQIRTTGAAGQKQATATMQRVVLGRGRRGVTDSDSDEQEHDEVMSRRSSPSTSPRHSLATPSSYGGDDLLMTQAGTHPGNTIGGSHGGIGASNGGGHGEEKTMSDSRSVDSGVVQSDHSAQQQQQQQQQGLAAFAQQSQANNIHFGESMASYGASRQQQQQMPVAQSPSPVPPPIPPRSATIATPPKPLPPGLAQQIGAAHSKRPSSASAGTVPPTPAAAWLSRVAKTAQPSNDSSRESIMSAPGSRDQVLMCSAMSTSSLVPALDQPSGSRRSTQSTVPPMDACKEQEELHLGEGQQRKRSTADMSASGGGGGGGKDSPTFMSSPEDDSSTLGSIQFNLTYLVDEKQLIIHLIRAKNLKAMDKNGFSDPYVKFHLLPGNAKATKLTSKTIEKTLNPEWNEEMIYYGITEEERLRKTLRVTVLDRDRIGSDFLGETRVALRKLPPALTKKFNLYLEHAIPIPLEKSAETERGKLLLSVCYNIQQGSLFVSIKRCAELLGMDSTGFSDPYCKVSLTPLTSKAHRQKTSIKKRTLNPEFNESMQFLVPFKDLPKKTLEVGVYDYDVGRHDDYIGGVVLSTAAPGERGKQWQQVIENPGKTFEYWHKLEADD